MDFLNYLSIGIGLFAIMVLVWGAIRTAVSLLRLELFSARREDTCHKRERLRQHFGSYILLGLEFLVAADVIHTIMKPTFQEVAILGSIIGIRTVLSFFLNRELAAHNCE